MAKQAQKKSGMFIYSICIYNMIVKIFVDCTASDNMAILYKNILSSNISVVTANKVADFSDFDKQLINRLTNRNRADRA